ncbi:uncharacterized protein B0I36DRAFT_335030 [Microdochium trichocladiopsis]|uniref:Uncharacterized protein n=1 Tax=Microdochium trichocladiopsis TaxID=1682393 RepID=A0A9P9BF12_9PEZI|nr:uncharacterized protein B0I36DRAFT_342228 [Microdochium trichocladiopsis]XP_046007854.1 uncharacterized protein B0I36DRAFT_335030 [Microdochium trichocladiopsis]KAH7009388.1 hypothetical protein B0I36DRAFT_342228 [Microdochium trichocladiopsis]KAH7021653.1 hypothetical protein B0I36DRAFT_335030 [Microdochium trichocladiopsis]
MAPELHIIECICRPASALHPPPSDKPLRIQIEGPLVSIAKLFPDTPWDVSSVPAPFPQLAGRRLAELTYEKIYGQRYRPDIEGDLVVRDEYLGWVPRRSEIDYYGVTFDHLIPAHDQDPEVLQINIIEMDEDKGAYANQYLPFHVDWKDYAGKRILAVPRCCQRRIGSTDRRKINDGVNWRDNATRQTALDNGHPY